MTKSIAIRHAITITKCDVPQIVKPKIIIRNQIRPRKKSAQGVFTCNNSVQIPFECIKPVYKHTLSALINLFGNFRLAVHQKLRVRMIQNIPRQCAIQIPIQPLTARRIRKGSDPLRRICIQTVFVADDPIPLHNITRVALRRRQRRYAKPYRYETKGKQNGANPHKNLENQPGSSLSAVLNKQSKNPAP